ADAVKESLGEEYRPVSVFFTTGRSALPTAFLLTRYDLDILEEVGRRIVQVAKINSPDDKVLSVFPYAPHLAFWQVYYCGVGAGIFTLNTGGGKVMGTDGILQSLLKIRPSYIVGIPGYVYHMLREAHARSLDLSFVKGLALGGDAVTPGYRTRVCELLENMGAKNPRVASVLGFTEARKCWVECEGGADAGFHTYPDLEIIEVVDPDTGKPVPEGETGELVYSSIDGRGSTVLRYRTGDILVGGGTWEQCPHCGRRVYRMSSTLERVSNMKNFQLSKVKGTLVNLNQFKDILENDDRVEEWQLVIKKRNDDPYDVDEIHLNLALSNGNSELDDVRESIEKNVLERTEVNLNSTNVLPLPEVLDLLGMETQLKEQRIVDLRASSAGTTAEVTTEGGDSQEGNERVEAAATGTNASSES
ncbi:MAG: AMP-binding protein, partial [Planctomycetota bacterium]